MLRNRLLGTVAAASLGLAVAALSASPAWAVPILTQFNFVPTGAVTANTGDVTTATTITSGAPDIVTFIQTDNTGLTGGTGVTLTSPTPVTLGATFTKSFTTALGTFLENLIVTLITPGPSSLGITATGTITETVYISGPVFDPTSVFYSAAYTQNGGPGSQINASFNNSTIARNVPEPSSLTLFGASLLGLGYLWRRKAKRSS